MIITPKAIGTCQINPRQGEGVRDEEENDGFISIWVTVRFCYGIGVSNPPTILPDRLGVCATMYGTRVFISIL